MTMTGGPDTAPESSSSGSPSSGSYGSSPTRPSRVATMSGALVSLTVIAIITHAWFTGKLDHAPWWAPLGGLLIAAIPGGVLGREIGRAVTSVGSQLVERLPWGKGGK